MKKLFVVKESGVEWFEITGEQNGFEFDGELVGVTEDDRILDCDGCPYTEGDHIEIAIRNALHRGK